MVDTEKLYKLIDDFAFHSRPSNADDSGVCKVEDINRVVKGCANVLRAIVAEIENSEIQ